MKKPLVTIFLFITTTGLAINLASCAVLAVTTGVVVGGALVYQHKKIENYVGDKKIAATANNRIYADKDLYADNHIVIGVKRAVVLLVGQAKNEALKQRAEHIVKSIHGIERVYNEIVVGPFTSLRQKGNDLAITSKIKVAMLKDKRFDPSAIKVITENNVVYLMGLVTSQQADQAVSIAKNTQDVTKVFKVMQYIPIQPEGTVF